MKFNKSLIAVMALVGTISVGISVTNAACLGTGSSCSEDITVSVSINPGDVCIGSDATFDFGGHTVASTGQTVSASFTNPFWIEDMRGEDVGYYTTVQMSGDLHGSGSNIISGANISMRASGGITTIAGTTNANVVVDAAVTASFQPLNNPITLIKRDNAVNNGIIGRYGTTPDLQLAIPAYQGVGTYSGTLVYTLYEN